MLPFDGQGRAPTMLMASAANIVVLVALAYGAFLLFVFFRQEKLLYLPDLPGRELERSPAAIGLNYEEVFLQSADNVRLHGWYVPAPKSRGVVLFCHGNAGNISHRLDSLEIFHGLGLSVLIFDYRGYGRSEGRPTEKGTYADAEAAWQYLVDEQQLESQQIILFGRSLGAAVAAELATRHKARALIVESTFTSVPDMAAELYPLLPSRLLCRLRYDVRAALPQVSCPVLVVHSPDDEIIPFAHGQSLYEAAHEPKDFLEIRGGHNEGFLVSGSTYRDGLAHFVAPLLGQFDL